MDLDEGPGIRLIGCRRRADGLISDAGVPGPGTRSRAPDSGSPPDSNARRSEPRGAGPHAVSGSGVSRTEKTGSADAAGSTPKEGATARRGSAAPGDRDGFHAGGL